MRLGFLFISIALLSSASGALTTCKTVGDAATCKAFCRRCCAANPGDVECTSSFGNVPSPCFTDCGRWACSTYTKPSEGTGNGSARSISASREMNLPGCSAGRFRRTADCDLCIWTFVARNNGVGFNLKPQLHGY
ncbi:hypothetical protein DFH09DRAFT_1276167 [Mycena vulgaris]|nr:hypothetical protein DFH09DRAFT_1276167 [Mycena vulgaris]